MGNHEDILGYQYARDEDKEHPFWDDAKVALQPLYEFVQKRGWDKEKTKNHRVFRREGDIVTCGLAIQTPFDAYVLLMARRYRRNTPWYPFLELSAQRPTAHGVYQLHAKTDIGVMLGGREHAEATFLLVGDPQQGARWNWSTETVFTGPNDSHTVVVQTIGELEGKKWKYAPTSGFDPLAIAFLIRASFTKHVIDPAKPFDENRQNMEAIMFQPVPSKK